MIYLKTRVDDQVVPSGYLGCRGENVDERDSLSGYLSATGSQISSWRLIEYDDGFLI